MPGQLQEVLRAQESPQDALMALCAFVEELTAEVEVLKGAPPQPASNAWSTWQDTEVPDSSSEWEPKPEDEATLARLKSELSGCEDDEQSKVLRAEIFLCEDLLKPPPDMFDDEGDRTEQVTDDKGNVLVDIPSVSEDERAERAAFAREVLKLQEVYGDQGEEFIESYAKGGPLVIYLTDRDFVMGLPDDVKRAMVNDVIKTSPKEGHEMARDLLKDMEPGGPDVSVGNLVRMMGD